MRRVEVSLPPASVFCSVQHILSTGMLVPSPLSRMLFGSRMRAAATVVAALAILLAAAIGIFLSVAGPQRFEFSQHQRVSASSVLQMSFPEEMDRKSVEESLTIPEDLAVDREWSGNVLLLKPKQKLASGKTYIVRVGGHAKKADGTELGRELTYTFVVAGAPMLTAQIPPPNTRGVPASARIAMVFDRPVVPLSQVQGGKSAERFSGWPVTITPDVRGRWRWLGTTTAEFVPEKGLKLATQYRVNVPAGMKTLSGDATEKDFSWTFETERPGVVSVSPQEGNADAGPTTELTFHFNQEIDLISAKDSMSLREGGTPSGQGKALAVKSVKYGTKEVREKKVTDKTAIVVVPSAPYAFSRVIVATVAKGIRGLVGDLGSSSGFTLTFSTVGTFEVQSGKFEDGRVQVRFSNPVKDASLKGNIVFDPPVEGLAEDLSTNEWEQNKTLQLYLQLKPSTKYTVTVQQGVSDAYGQKLAGPFTFTFTTPAIRPQVFLYPEGKTFSVFERGKPPMYFLNNVNVSGLSVELGSLTLERFLSLRNERKDGTLNPFDMQTVSSEYRKWDMKSSGKRNVWEAKPFDLEKQLGKPLKSGIYRLSLSAPEYALPTDRPSDLWEERFFAVTNMGITLKYSGGKLLAWVTDLQTGDPVPGAVVAVRALSQRTPIVSGKTDKDGFFETNVQIADFKTRVYDWQPEFWVTATKGDDFAFVGSDWNNGLQPYMFDGVYSDFRSPESNKIRLQSFVYTDRPVYRAGDTMHFKALIRYLDWNGKYSVPPAGRTVEMVISDPNGKEVYRKQLKVSEFGSVADSFTVAKEAVLGYYSLNGQIVGDENAGSQGVYGNFSVLAYRKPEYRVEVKPQAEEYFNGDAVRADISGQYYFGAPMSQSKVVWRATSTDYYFNKYTDGWPAGRSFSEGWYSFVLEDQWCWRDCSSGMNTITSGEGTLDDRGLLSVSFPVNIDALGVSQVVSIETDITDKNNQVVSGRADVIVHKAKVYVGLASEDYGVPTGGEAKVKVVTVNTDGSKAPGKTVEFKLFSRTWNTVKEKGVDGEYYYDNKPTDTFVRSFTARTDEEGKAAATVTLDQGGEFRLVASVKDDAGREAKAGIGLYAWSDTSFNWPHANNDRMEIIADKPVYNVGDTAKLLVKTPYQGKGVKALVTVERENVITKKVVDVRSNALPIEVPVTDDLVPTAYVSVVIMKPRIGETFDEKGIDTGSPAFKIGYVKLPIDTSKRKLTVKLRTDKERYLPGEQVTVYLETIDPKGNPVPAELSLGVVDLSVLDLAGFRMPDLVEAFYSERGVGVMTANMLTQLMERFKPGTKGGGGGESPLQDRARGTFLDTAYWNASIVTDKNGQASVTFKLPDNLTTWHFLALGSTKDHLFGGEAKTAIETKQVILRPVRPRFAVRGDRVTLGAIVHNYLSEDRSFTVSLKGTGFTLSGKASETITVPKNGNTKVSFPVTIGEAGKVTLEFSAVSGSARDVIQETIPVFPFGTEQSNALSGIVENRETEKVAIPTEDDAPTGSLTVAMSPSLAVYLPGGLQYLATFPYGCAEQTVSSFLPNVALKQLRSLRVFSAVPDKTLDENVSVGLQKLYAFQLGDGGFGYFEGSTRSYPVLTAYILSALKIANDAGFAVDSGVRERAKKYLEDVLHSNKQEQDVSPTLRAYILFVLSEEGSTDTALLNNLSKKQESLPLFGKAYLAMAYRKAGTIAAAGRAKELMATILSAARIDARGARFDEEDRTAYGAFMNTDDRTNAIILQALVRIDPENPLTAKLVRGMLASRRAGHWDTTQSTALSLLSLVEYLKQTKELQYDFVGAIEVDGKKALEHTYKSEQSLTRQEALLAFSSLPRGKTVDVNIGKEGKGRLYYDLLLSYFYAPDTLEPAEEGIGILRETEPLQKEADGLKVGETYKVTLTITVPETRNFVAVESPLPAGLEPIDLQYATAQQNLLAEKTNAVEDAYRSQLWRFSHTEMRDDRVFLFAEELPPGIYVYEYLVRATTPGRFRERPARVFEMYFPETFGQTGGGWVDVSE